ncbi:MAG TPA: hypothetical protein VK510_14420 [Solirubrobacteraceae bacterium]|nr:hypothetical protein [Solirubrobacteraceae bacterium]
MVGERAGGVQVLDEVAARQDVEQLRAAAHAEDRHVGAQRSAQDREIALVAVAVGLAEVRAGPLAVEPGVDVGHAAGQNDGVDADEVDARTLAHEHPHPRTGGFQPFSVRVPVVPT